MTEDKSATEKIELHNLSGIYFREKVGDKFENICFEELSEGKQNEILNTKDVEFIKNLSKELSKTIVMLGDRFGIFNS